MMVDLAQQLVEKWERLNPDEEIDVPADMTRLTLDTIGMCGFGYRFNSFYREEPHPFVASMMLALIPPKYETSRVDFVARERHEDCRQCPKRPRERERGTDVRPSHRSRKITLTIRS